MTQVTWTELYRLGIPSIDDDHQRLVDRLERVLDALAAAESAEAVGDRLDALITEAEGHFGREIDLLDRANYPGLAAHRVEHDRLLNHLRHLRATLRHGLPKDDDGSRTAQTLCDWLFRHIREDDAAFKPFVLRLV